MANSIDDETLMLQFKQGDYMAFETLYRRHKQPLFRFMTGLCSNRAVAEELFQEVWMKLIDAKDRYQNKAKFTTYLFQIARNRIIDHYRKLSTKSELNTSDMDLLVEGQSSQIQNQPDQLIEAEQTLYNFTNILENLPVEQKEVFLLKENASMSLNEIAELLGENVETIKSRLRYAVNKLHQGLKST